MVKPEQISIFISQEFEIESDDDIEDDWLQDFWLGEADWLRASAPAVSARYETEKPEP